MKGAQQMSLEGLSLDYIHTTLLLAFFSLTLLRGDYVQLRFASVR